MNDHSREFDCAECGRHIIQMIPDDRHLCAECIFMPGWFKNDDLRAVLDPEHDGKEAKDRPR